MAQVLYPKKWSPEAYTLITDYVNTHMNKLKLMDKYKDIEAISMGSSESLVISFHGFQDRDEVKEFADYIFSRIKMNYQSLEKPPSIH